jgi:hypothetical protein
VAYYYNYQVAHGTGNGGVYYTNHNRRALVQRISAGVWLEVGAVAGDGYLSY